MFANQFARDVKAVGLMHSASQRGFVEADLSQHGTDSLDMDRLTIVRAARDCDFLFSESESIGCARCDDRQGLEGLS